MSGSELVNLVLDLKRKPWVGLLVLALAAAFFSSAMTARLEQHEVAIAAKADTAAITGLAREIRDLSNKIDSLNLRQRQYFCTGKPSFCR